MLVASIRSLSRSIIQLRAFSNRPSMNWSASVLTPISSDTEPTVILTFESAKYIFNVGENTNRAFLQSKHNWKRTKALFLTQPGTKRVGGLPGPFPENRSIPSSLNALDSRSTDDVRGWWSFISRYCWPNWDPSSIGFHADIFVPVRVSLNLYAFVLTRETRDTMRVQPIEVQPVVSSSPEPVYKDGNITVYGISLFPSSAIEQGMHLLRPDETSLKRKRSPTPDLPSKRAFTASNDNPSSDQIGTPPPSLSGTSAQDWRTSLLSLMFPANKKHDNLIASGKKKEAILAKKEEKEKGKSNASESQVNPPSEPDPEPVCFVNVHSDNLVDRSSDRHL